MLTAMRSGYGLCGFFLAGNEHVLIGTKVGSTNMESFKPGVPMTSIFEGQSPQNKAFSNQNKGHLGSRRDMLSVFGGYFFGLGWVVG